MTYMFEIPTPDGYVVEKKPATGLKFYHARVRMGIYGKPRAMRRKFKTCAEAIGYCGRFCRRYDSLANPSDVKS